MAGIVALGFAGAALWEVAGPFGAGHYAAGPFFATAAENMLRFGIWGAVPDQYPVEVPPPSTYYCHHPMGFFWVMALFLKAFGRADWVVRAPAVLMSGLSPLLLYATGRALWGPVAGVATAAGFAALPIALAFANLSNLEVPTIFGILIAIWGTVRLHQTWQRRWLAVSVLGFAFAAHMDWPGLMFSGGALGFLLLRGYVLPRWYGPVAAWRFGQFWAFSVSAVALVLLGNLLHFYSAGKLLDFLQQGEFRSSGAGSPLRTVLEARRYWILLSFTPLAIAIGQWGAVLLLLRATVGRRSLEFLPLALLAAASAHYLIFKNGADIHVFWAHYFAPYFGFALGVTVASVQDVLGRLGRALARRNWRFPLRLPEALGLGLGLLVSAAVLRDALPLFVYARATGGRFDEHGALITPDMDNVAFLRWLSPQLGPREGAVMAPSLRPAFWMSWSFQHPLRVEATPQPGPAPEGDRYFLLDSRFTGASTLLGIARQHPIQVVGPFWAVDRNRNGAGIEGYAVERRAPRGLERYFTSGTHDLLQVTPDPFVSWEYREHLGLWPNPPPSTPAGSLEQRRIWHNVLVSQGALDRALEARAALAAELEQRASAAPLSPTLLGVRYEHAASRVLSVYFLSEGPLSPFDRFQIVSRVVRPLVLSQVPADTQVREVGMPFAIPPELWKTGYVYASVSELMKRPGTEEFSGFWVRARFTGQEEPQVPLLTLD